MLGNERANGKTLLPREVSPHERAIARIEEELLAELRARLAARQALHPTLDDEMVVRGLIPARIAAASREALLAGRPPLPDPDGGLAQRILDDVLRFGPISRYLDDPRVEEICINDPLHVWLVVREDDGTTRTVLADVTFDSDADVLGLVRRVVADQGRRIDGSSPAVDARLPDGSRLHAIMPPLTSGHVAVTIRKFLMIAQSLEDLIRLGTISIDAARFLAVAIQAGVNCLISGGTSSGKTTSLNCLASTLTSPAQRTVTIEDTRELRLAEVLPNCIALEAREANAEGAGRVTIRDLVRHSLRMSPRKIVVGEVRGGEAVDMLLSMSSGQAGLCTIHANSARDALLRLKTYVLLGGEDIPERAALDLIASAIQLVVHQALTPEGQRRITAIFEVTGLEGATIVGNELYRREGGELVWTGIRPRCEGQIRAAGLRLPW